MSIHTRTCEIRDTNGNVKSFSTSTELTVDTGLVISETNKRLNLSNRIIYSNGLRYRLTKPAERWASRNKVISREEYAELINGKPVFIKDVKTGKVRGYKNFKEYSITVKGTPRTIGSNERCIDNSLHYFITPRGDMLAIGFEETPTNWPVIDNYARLIYNFGYNKFVLGIKDNEIVLFSRRVKALANYLGYSKQHTYTHVLQSGDPYDGIRYYRYDRLPRRLVIPAIKVINNMIKKYPDLNVVELLEN